MIILQTLVNSSDQNPVIHISTLNGNNIQKHALRALIGEPSHTDEQDKNNKEKRYKARQR